MAASTGSEAGTGGAAGTVDMGRLQGLNGCPTIRPHIYHCSKSGTTEFSMTERQPFRGQAVHADACFGCVHCQGTMGLRGDAEGEGAAESSCR